MPIVRTRFLGGTTILYSLPRPMPVRLATYDITGRKVRTLVNSMQGAGESRVTGMEGTSTAPASAPVCTSIDSRLRQRN